MDSSLLDFIGNRTAEAMQNHGREAVDEQDHVRPTSMLAFGYRELVNREPVVVLRVLIVDDLDLCSANRAIRARVLYRDAIYEQQVRAVVARDERRFVCAQEFALSFLDGTVW